MVSMRIEHSEISIQQSAFSEFNHQAVVRELDAWREPGAGVSMTKIVAHVREAGPSRGNARADLDRFLQREMRRMRHLAQRIDHDEIESLEESPRLVGDPAAVGEIRESPDPEPENGTLAMKDRDRRDLLMAQTKRADDVEQFDLRQPAPAWCVWIENVKKCSA